MTVASQWRDGEGSTALRIGSDSQRIYQDRLTLDYQLPEAYGETI